jgi:starch phosphorylase
MSGYFAYKPQERKVAYFSFEVGLSPELPIYAGGLGILAGDTIKAFADQGVPVVAVSLLNEKGYFYQELDSAGNQLEVPIDWDHTKYMTPLPEKVTVKLEGRDVLVQAWVHGVEGLGGYRIPVVFLDTNIKTNAEEDRLLTSYLYGGDSRYRLMQEAILGLGGVRILQILDHDNLERYHMNEGHSALLTLELMNRYEKTLQRVRELCVFTTHTPLQTGHDSFDLELVESVLGDFYDWSGLEHDNIIDSGRRLNMTYLALYHSKYVNGVAKKHGEVAQQMFPGYSIDAITNGIHTNTWLSEPMARVFDRHIPSWRQDPYCLRSALNIPLHELWDAHLEAKKKLIDFVNKHYHVGMDYETLTIGFARRAAAYKRADLLFTDKERLLEIHDKAGGFQVIFGGKAHPKDEDGKKMIKDVVSHINELRDRIKMVYLNNYDVYSARLLVAGADVWLNTPLRPLEASGTSGMKAAVNGVINFSVLDGWWLEGHIEDYTGWSIGPSPGDEDFKHIQVAEDSGEKQADVGDGGLGYEQDVEDLYAKLEEKIIPMYYENRGRWMKMMAGNIAFNGSYFNTHRMVSQYVMQAYFQ